MKNLYVIVLLFACLSPGLFSQSLSQMETNQMRVTVRHDGSAGENSAFFQIKEESEWKTMLFSAELWLGAKTPGGSLVVQRTNLNNELNIFGAGSSIPEPWYITIDDVLAHQEDYADNGVIDNPIDAIFKWPGRRNPHFEAYNGYSIDWANLFALGKFYDVNNDGIYDPMMGDYPAFHIESCFSANVIPSEWYLIPYTLGDATQPDVQLTLNLFRFGCEEDNHSINNAFFCEFDLHRIGYPGVETWEDIYLGLQIDGDVGCYINDYVGSDPARSLAYFYNKDATETACDQGVLPFEHPPAVGIDILQSPFDPNGSQVGVNAIMHYFNSSVGSFPVPTTGGLTDSDAYNYLQGKWNDGSPMTAAGIGYQTSGDPTTYSFSGNPATGAGWNEVSEDNPFGDRRMILSSGPFTLFPGARQTMLAGFSYHYDAALSHLEQVPALIERMDTIQSFYDSCFEGEELVGCQALMTPAQDIKTPINQMIIYPNPADAQLHLSAEGIKSGQLSVYNLLGDLVHQEHTSTTSLTLETNHWPSGTYLLHWKAAGQIWISKAVIHR